MCVYISVYPNLSLAPGMIMYVQFRVSESLVLLTALVLVPHYSSSIMVKLTNAVNIDKCFNQIVGYLLRGKSGIVTATWDMWVPGAC